MINLTAEERLLLRSRLTFEPSAPDVMKLVMGFAVKVARHVCQNELSENPNVDEIDKVLISINRNLRTEFEPLGFVVSMQSISQGENTGVFVEIKRVCAAVR